MSLTQIRAEVHRFLATDTPEVLCIKGRWGVGKTYGWRNFLKEAVSDNSLALKRYSYISLFGLNSLDELRFAIFERTVFDADIGENADLDTFQKLISKGNRAGRNFRMFLEGISTFFNRKGLSDVIMRSAFLSVQNQLICIDDLERAGDSLKVRDILGLSSYLKLERGCKVVLLLNEMEHNEKEEFEKQLEKVADVTLTFSPTPEEAVNIALSGSTDLLTYLRPLIVHLGITNIRIIKKIEIYGERLAATLEGFSRSVVEQAMATLVLACWSVYQPSNAPTIDFLRSYNRHLRSSSTSTGSSGEEKKSWISVLETYPFTSLDDLDVAIIDGVCLGYFDNPLIYEIGKQLQEQHRRTSRESIFSKAWDELYHGSLAVEDDVFLNELYRGSIEEADAISALNINSAIRILRECGRAEQANEVIDTWFLRQGEQPLDFFKTENHHFFKEDEVDVVFKAAFEERWWKFKDERNPLDVLRELSGRGWRDADVGLMAKQSVSDFERLFEALHGRDLRLSIDAILQMGRSNSEGASTIKINSLAALLRIAGKSPLRARKIQRFGIDLNDVTDPEAPAIP